jgi:scyllo-inositol 2-dehydrogenase (NADP+)
MPPIKTALLSFGMSGKLFHAPFIKAHSGFQLIGAWERTAKNIQAIYPSAHSYASLQALLKDQSIELVVVNTPNYTHYEYAKAALLAGKHIIVEKAFTTTVAEAVALKVLAEKHQRKISVFQSRRWDSDFKTVQKILNENWLGDIVEAELRFDRYRPAMSTKAHKETNLPGSGLLNDLGPHLIDQAICLFGMPQALMAEIRMTRPGSQVDDWFDISLHYLDKRVRLKAGFFVREAVPAYAIHGSKGSFLKTRGDIQEKSLLAGKTPNAAGWGIEPENEEGILHTEKDGMHIRKKIPTEVGNYFTYYDCIYKALRENKAMPVTCEEGIAVMKVIEAATESNERKAVVTV